MAITAVANVDDIFAVGRKERCDRLCTDLNRAIPVKNGRADAGTQHLKGRTLPMIGWQAPREGVCVVGARFVVMGK